MYRGCVCAEIISSAAEYHVIAFGWRLLLVDPTGGQDRTKKSCDAASLINYEVCFSSRDKMKSSRNLKKRERSREREC